MKQSVDLLYETPQTRISLPALAGALPYAFSAGDTGDLFKKALGAATLGPTCFDEGCFASDLFLDELLKNCCRVNIAGSPQELSLPYVKRALCSPPEGPSTTHMRQQILSELLHSPRHREHLESVYLELKKLRGWFDGDGMRLRLELTQRRIDILRAISTAFRWMEEHFGDCNSELKRLHVFAKTARQTEGFGRLEQLLSYEDNLATLDLRVRVGIDGRLRDFNLVDFEENQENPFHSGWFSRWWVKLIMLARGYRFSEHELIVRLTDQVFEGIERQTLELFQLIGDLEFYLAGLAFSDLARRRGFRTCFPRFIDQAERPAVGGLCLEGLFNPFLVAEGNRVKCCDVRTQRGDAMMVITGPNSGGKTRLLQAVALCQLLGQAGLMVPAARAELIWAGGMFVSIIADVSADQREGRLGMELLRIRRLFEQIKPGDVVVLDELCSGTNPSEGEEIFRLVVELLAELKPQLWLTTHFLQLAQRLQQEVQHPPEPRQGQQEWQAGPLPLEFLQVELVQQQPTYQFVPGVAQTSLAGQTAARLGVTRQELTALVTRAKSNSRVRDDNDAQPESPPTSSTGPTALAGQ